MHNYSIKALDDVAALCELKRIPIIIHLSSESESYKIFARKIPDLKIIYAHAGLPFWKKCWKYIKDQPNVYVDTSSDYLNRQLLRKLLNI